MKKIIILFICLTSSIWHVCAQTKVSGIVKDAQGMEMIGATVLQKGTNNGIVTGLDGKFTLTLSNEAEQTLLISMIGFIEQSIAIKKNHPFINVTLEEDIAQLDEVVVVGYGTQKKVSLTGSISNVGTEDLKSMPVSSVTNALGGRIPGLVTRQESGRPGGDQATMFIRGRASLNDSSPLVLIDGVERPMAQIDPDDIETISVLKDASATAVYGVRGANGVILVTTRRGREGLEYPSHLNSVLLPSIVYPKHKMQSPFQDSCVRVPSMMALTHLIPAIPVEFSCQSMITISIVPRKVRLHTRTTTL